MIAEQYTPVAGPNVMAPLCYLGIDENTPLGRMIDTTFNLRITTIAGVLNEQINISSWDPFFLTGIYFIGTGEIFLKPYDGEGEEIFTDFFLQATSSTDPFPLVPGYPFRPNDNLRFDVLDEGGGSHLVEVAFRGYTLGLGGV